MQQISYAKTVYGQEEIDAVVKCLKDSLHIPCQKLMALLRLIGSNQVNSQVCEICISRAGISSGKRQRLAEPLILSWDLLALAVGLTGGLKLCKVQ